jgi:hypothetical protein
MRVYAESNFVLELVFEQEQHSACEQMVALAETSQIQLVLPAMCVLEPFTTLHRRQRECAELKQKLDQTLREIGQTHTFSEQAALSSTISALLVRSAEEAATRFEAVCARIVRSARLLPLDAANVERATRHGRDLGLKLPDALVLVSVLRDLETCRRPSCFLNRNSKDFDDPAITDTLENLGCKYLGGFDSGLEYVQSQLRSGVGEPA